MMLRDIYRNLISPRKTRIYYVSDNQNWSFRWDAEYITRGLRENVGVDANITVNPWKMCNQIIHFGDRYAYLRGPHEALAERNKLFLTWFHGEKSDPNPDMQWLFDRMPAASRFAEKIVISCKLSEPVLNDMGITSDRIALIPLGVDLNVFKPLPVAQRRALRAKMGIPEDAICIGSFQKDSNGWGEGTEPKLVKGPDVFLDAVSKIHSKCRNVMVLLTGPARGYVKSGLDKLGIPYLHSLLDNYLDVVNYYAMTDLYVIASRAEGGPKALLESWATGVPVVSTRVGMPADLIDHGINGMLSKIEDANGLAQSALELIENPEKRTVITQKALADVAAYDWPLVSEQYYELLYKSLLERKHTA